MKLPIWKLRAAERQVRQEHREHPTIWSAELVKRLDYWKSPWMRRKAIIEITEFSGVVYARLRQVDPHSPFLVSPQPKPSSTESGT